MSNPSTTRFPVSARPTPRSVRTTAGVLFGLAALVLGGCSDDDPASEIEPAGDAPAACPVDDPTCYETGTEDSGG